MTKQFQKYLLVAVFTGIIFSLLGYDYGRKGYLIDLKKTPPGISIVNQKPASETLDFSLFWQVFDLLNRKSIYRPLDLKKVLYGAIKGMTDSLGDPYTTFLDPEQNESVKSSLEGKYEGIGAELGIVSNQLIIVTPLDDSPAKSANVKAGDSILRIDGKSTVGITLNEAVTKIRGKAGTMVTLTLGRRGREDPFDVSIKREKITVKSIKWEEKEDSIVYLRVSRFGESTNSEWDKAITEIKSQVPNLKGMIIDVRYNSGGYLQSAIHLASEFIARGSIVLEEYADGTRQSYKVDHQGVLLEIPVVVMINRGSASASEILAGALRDLRGSKLVGEKSFGKGSVQDAKDFSDGSGVHITIAKWLTPKGVSINGQGLEADVKIEISEEEASSSAEKDLELEKALEVIKKEEGI